MNKISHEPITQLRLTEAQFCAWIGEAALGAVIEYHRGFLAIDTVRVSSNSTEADRNELLRLGRRAWWAAEKNLVHLVQRRLGPDRFAYLAIARSRPNNLHVMLQALMAEASESSALANPNISLRRTKS